MGWTLERWRYSTFYEYNVAVDGYWRNWERFVAWGVREINFTAIAGNPNIKPANKPKRSTDLYKLTDDKVKKKEAPSIEELKKTHAKFFER